jgi:hypothetical protein
MATVLTFRLRASKKRSNLVDGEDLRSSGILAGMFDESPAALRRARVVTGSDKSSDC